MASLINISTSKLCAFCQYWWDPTCKFIQPHVGSQWYYESSGRCRCIKKGIETTAATNCNNYKCKINW